MSDTELEPCPVCKAHAVVVHINDSYDNVDFGWDAGCPRYKVDDGIHTKPMVVHGLGSKEAAIEAWNRRANEV